MACTTLAVVALGTAAAARVTASSSAGRTSGIRCGRWRATLASAPTCAIVTIPATVPSTSCLDSAVSAPAIQRTIRRATVRSARESATQLSLQAHQVKPSGTLVARH